MAQSNAALKVGVVVVIAMLLLGGVAYFFLGRGAGGYPVDVYFRDVQGIKEEADVRLSGVRIGSVKKITVDPDGRHATLHLRIRRGQRIPLNARWTVTSGGLLGELFVNIEPPKPRSQEQLAEGLVPDTGEAPRIEGTDLPTFDQLKVMAADLSDDSKDVLTNLKIATANIAALSQDPALQQALRGSVISVQRMTKEGAAAAAEVGMTAQQVNASFRRNLLPTLEAAMGTVDQAARNVEMASRQAGPLAGNANAVLLNAQQLVRGLDETNRFLRDTLADTFSEADAGPQLHDTLANLTEASRQFKLAAEDAHRITTDLASGTEGSSKLGNAVVAVENAANKAGGLLDKITGVTERATRHHGPLVKAVPQLDVYQQLTGDTRFRADLNVAFPSGDNSALIVGLRDLGEGNKLNLQYSGPSGDRMRLRYGFHAGKVGLGADYNLVRNPVAPPILSLPGATSLSAELYDPNHLQLDLYGRYQINNNLGLALGMEDILHNSRPTVGLTYRP